MNELELHLALVLGPDGDAPMGVLRRGWQRFGAEMLADCRRNPVPGWRPAGWWMFDVCEPKPDGDAAEARRLVELGVLKGEELVAVERRARDAIHGIEAMNRAEAAGAVKTGPDGVGPEMRERRERDRLAWGRVLEALAA